MPVIDDDSKALEVESRMTVPEPLVVFGGW
jgi:hypothetical protein